MDQLDQRYVRDGLAPFVFGYVGQEIKHERE